MSSLAGKDVAYQERMKDSGPAYARMKAMTSVGVNNVLVDHDTLISSIPKFSSLYLETPSQRKRASEHVWLALLGKPSLDAPATFYAALALLVSASPLHDIEKEEYASHWNKFVQAAGARDGGNDIAKWSTEIIGTATLSTYFTDAKEQGIKEVKADFGKETAPDEDVTVENYGKSKKKRDWSTEERTFQIMFDCWNTIAEKESRTERAVEIIGASLLLLAGGKGRKAMTTRGLKLMPSFISSEDDTYFQSGFGATRKEVAMVLAILEGLVNNGELGSTDDQAGLLAKHIFIRLRYLKMGLMSAGLSVATALETSLDDITYLTMAGYTDASWYRLESGCLITYEGKQFKHTVCNDVRGEAMTKYLIPTWFFPYVRCFNERYLTPLGTRMNVILLCILAGAISAFKNYSTYLAQLALYAPYASLKENQKALIQVHIEYLYDHVSRLNQDTEKYSIGRKALKDAAEKIKETAGLKGTTISRNIGFIIPEDNIKVSSASTGAEEDDPMTL